MKIKVYNPNPLGAIKSVFLIVRHPQSLELFNLIFPQKYFREDSTQRTALIKKYLKLLVKIITNDL
jgi:hypothetical protein